MIEHLSNLKKGQSAIVVEIGIEDINRKIHILEMGLTKGTKIKVKKIAPMGDPISIEIRGYELCLSKKDSEKIIIKRI